MSIELFMWLSFLVLYGQLNVTNPKKIWSLSIAYTHTNAHTHTHTHTYTHDGSNDIKLVLNCLHSRDLLFCFLYEYVTICNNNWIWVLWYSEILLRSSAQSAKGRSAQLSGASCSQFPRNVHTCQSEAHTLGFLATNSQLKCHDLCSGWSLGLHILEFHKKSMFSFQILFSLQSQSQPYEERKQDT